MSEPGWSEEQLTSVLLSTLDANLDNQEDLSRYQPALEAFTNDRTLEGLERENDEIWKEHQAQSSTVDLSDLDTGIRIPPTEELISCHNWTHVDVERGYRGGPVKFQYFQNPDFANHEEKEDVASVSSSVESTNAMAPSISSSETGLLPQTAINIPSSPASTSTFVSMSTPTDFSMLSEPTTSVSSFTHAGSPISTSSLSDSSVSSAPAPSIISSSSSSISSMVSTVSPPPSTQHPESVISIASSPAESASDSSELPEPAMSVDSSPAQGTKASGPTSTSHSDPNQIPAPAISTSVPVQSIKPVLLANFSLAVPIPLPDISTYPPPEGTLAPMDILLDPTKLRAPFTFRAAAQLSQPAPVDLPARRAHLTPSAPAATIYSSPAPRAQTMITTPKAPGALSSPLPSAPTPTVSAPESPCVARAARKRRATVDSTPAALAIEDDGYKLHPDLGMGIERFLMQAFPDEITPLQKRRVLNASPLAERIRYCRQPTSDMAYGGRKLSIRSLRGMVFLARLAEARRVARRAARMGKTGGGGGLGVAQSVAAQDLPMVDVQAER
ncbi:hypothetical protein BDW42DRAFT_199654 [Aspergillus taichungensis]|uniref:Uncharacterized protein n=1 Tax=Aspergillus taichungensis TaxID=482145 RepID=A0A2J5HE35_9EURO|nr:hypothetical protein BDW42DRAFT_199654 [Aspergillus taichungensis]